MADIVFTMPADRAELLNELNNNYTVRNVVIPGEIISKLSDAQSDLREQGATFIIDNFDTYYSVLHHANTLRPDVIFKAYTDLSKAIKQLDSSIAYLLDDKESLNDELKTQTVTMMKMLTYIYIQFVMYMEQQRYKAQEELVGRNKNKQAKKDDDFAINKRKILDSLNCIIHRDIASFWNPPIVEHEFVTSIAELCHFFLQHPSIKQEKETRDDIFTVFGTLIKSYDYGNNFVTRLVQSIRMYEHVVQCAPEGIKLVVEQFGCRQLIHYFVKEATEWQEDETFQDNQGTRACSGFLTELAVLMPDLMIPEAMYLNKYLTYESQPLRMSVLNVITEIVLKVLTKHELSDEERESRDEFLDDLIEHIRDVSAMVRVKVIHNLARLQKENALPLNYQNEVLEKVIEHLNDKAAAVRKAAIGCITTFLEHNPFGAHLQLKKTEAELAKKTELLNRMEASYKEAKNAKIEEMRSEWTKIEDEVRKTIQEQLETDEDEDTEAQPTLEKNQIVEMVRSKLEEKKYAEAFKLCRLLKDKIDEWKDLKKVNREQEVNLYLTILCSFFLNVEKITDELRTGAGMTDEDIQKIEALEKIIKYLNDTVTFLRVIDSAIGPMKTLLFTQTIGDMHEAINFFVTAFQFQIDNASAGIIEMLKLMQYNEQERKDAVIEAFKTIYLITDTRNMVEHTTTVLNRLISMLKDITSDNYEDFQSIVSEWTAKGILDNSIIDRCWQYYTKREPVSDEDARAAAILLKMAATGRHTIITKNIALVTTVAFSEKNENDMRFLAASCRLLAVSGSTKIDIQSENTPWKLKPGDKIFQNLSIVLVEKFFDFERSSFYMEAVEASLDFMFRVCSKPTEVCEKILKQIHERMVKTTKKVVMITRFCQFLGCTAFNLLGYLDNIVYRELKRRNFLREARKENKKNNNQNKANTTTNKSTVSNETSANESTLMGAQAVDDDSEFILNVLENYVVSKTAMLGQYVNFLKEIIQRPDVYNNLTLQQVAIVALIRFMLVSSKFCRDQIRLLFTIFERTQWPEITCTILIHCADLLTRFPNVVEPWSPRIYGKLRDPLVQVRKTAFYSLSNLILRDMIRAHSHISEMAACMIDENQEIRDMCKTFFRRLAQKEHNLVNVMPDIFSHLVQTDMISEDNLRCIMRFLFDLVDDSKRAENLVDRFCHKYSVNDDPKLNRNITYCLSLISYNDKALRKLHETFPIYKHHLHDTEIYSTFKQILTECGKQKVGKVDLKPIISDIEACIASVFEINEDGQPAKPPPVVKPAKKSRNKAANKRKTSKKQDSDSDLESDEEFVKKTKKTNRRKKTRASSDSD